MDIIVNRSFKSIRIKQTLTFSINLDNYPDELSQMLVGNKL